MTKIWWFSNVILLGISRVRYFMAIEGIYGMYECAAS